MQCAEEILFYLILQFIYESKSERIIEISPCLFAKVIVEIKVTAIFMAHGVYILLLPCRHRSFTYYNKKLNQSNNKRSLQFNSSYK